MYRWIFFLVTEIEQPLWRIARHTFIYPEAKRLPQDVALARQDCLAMVAVLERHMAEREFMAGDRLSVADLKAAYTPDWRTRRRCSKTRTARGRTWQRCTRAPRPPTPSPKPSRPRQ